MRVTVRSVLLLMLVMFVASPLQGQKRARRDATKITLEELAEYGNASMSEVISRARPEFLIPPSLSPGDKVVTGVQGVVVYVGTQLLGDPSSLRDFRASEI